jgi:drug/metabolite transporter (DMT)-like permease
MWLPLSFINAIFDSLQNIYYKKAGVHVSPTLTAWSVLVVSGLCFSPLLLRGVPSLDTTFWLAVWIRLVVDSLAFSLFVMGIQKAPLSLAAPMTALSPILSVFTVFLTSRLLPTPLGFVGVLVSVVGIYFLNFDHGTKHPLSPFRAIFREKGVLYVTGAAILWSLVSALQKLAIDHSNPYFYTAFFQIFWAVCFTPIAFLANRKQFSKILSPEVFKVLIPGGILDAVKTIAQNAAYVFAIPAYVNSVGNTSILFSFLFGALLFKEKMEHKVLPILLIFIGITLLAFFH